MPRGTRARQKTPCDVGPADVSLLFQGQCRIVACPWSVWQAPEGGPPGCPRRVAWMEESRTYGMESPQTRTNHSAKAMGMVLRVIINNQANLIFRIYKNEDYATAVVHKLNY